MLDRKYLPVVILLLVAAILGYQLVLQRSLFLDEANLIRNIYARTLTGLFRPLDYEQYAPPLFLLITKGMTEILGHSEWVYRLWPALAAWLGFISLYYFLKPRVDPWIISFIFLLLIACPFLLRYATECKQYSTDFMVCCFLLYIFRTEKSLLPTKILTVALCPWLSMPSVLVIASLGLVDFFRSASKRKETFLLGGLALASFAVYYFTLIRHDIGSDYLLSVHAGYFPSFSLLSAETWQHNMRLLFNWLAMHGNHTVVGLLFSALALISGLCCTFRAEKFLGWPFILLVFLTWVLSGLHLYLWRPRTLLFLLPVFYLASAFLLQAVTNLRSKSTLPLVAALLALSTLFVITLSRSQPWREYRVTDYKAILHKINTAPIETVLASSSTYPVLLYHNEIKRDLSKTLLTSDSLERLSSKAFLITHTEDPTDLIDATVIDTVFYGEIDLYLLGDFRQKQ